MARSITWKCKKCPATWTVPLEHATDRPSGMPDAIQETICNECLDKMGRTPGPKKRNPAKGTTP